MHFLFFFYFLASVQRTNQLSGCIHCLNKITSLRYINHAPIDCTHNAIPPNTNPSPNHVSLAIIFRSTYHSPRTVKRNALELDSGTVRESSIQHSLVSSFPLRIRLGTVKGHTVFPNKEKEPYTPGQIDNQWNRIGRCAKEVEDRPEEGGDLLFYP